MQASQYNVNRMTRIRIVLCVTMMSPSVMFLLLCSVFSLRVISIEIVAYDNTDINVTPTILVATNILN